MNNYETQPTRSPEYAGALHFPDDFINNIDEKQRADQEALRQLIAKADAKGKENFNVDKASRFYHPDDLTNDENQIIERIKGLESDYYRSNAMTIEEWAKEREAYDITKDSTGSE
jgi:ribosomal protein S6